MIKTALCLVVQVMILFAAEYKFDLTSHEKSTFSRKILLEPDADLNSITVELEKSSIKPSASSAPVSPSSPSFIIKGAVNGEIFENKTKKSDEKYFLKTGQLDAFKIADLTLFTPQNYRSITLKVETKQMRSAGTDARPAHFTQLENSICNPEALKTYGARRSRSAELPGYAILTTDSLAEALKSLPDFIALKEEKGFDVQVITNSMWGGGTGDVAAENIRSWINNNYESMNLEYILFIGYPHPERGEVPMKMTWPQFQLDKYREAPTDFYYAELTGNWDVDNDGYFGEFDDDFMVNGGPDQYAELNIGRIPVYTKTKTDHILEKMIKYEREPQDSAQSWRLNALLPMNNMNGTDDPSFTPGIRLAEAIKYDILEPNGFNSFRIFDDNYDGFGLQSPAELTPCTYATVKETWNNNNFGLVVWQAHGFAQHATDVMSIPFSKVLNDDKVPFVFSTSCHNGRPETDNLSMHLLQNGAVNVVSASRVEYWAPGQDGFWDTWPSGGSISYSYTRNLINDSLSSAKALNKVKADIATEMLQLNSMWWMNWLVYNVNGDPSQGIYSWAKNENPQYPPALKLFDDIVLSEEHPNDTVDLRTKVEDGDNSFSELLWETPSSDIFTFTIENEKLIVSAQHCNSYVNEDIAISVTDPDMQSDTGNITLIIDGSTAIITSNKKIGRNLSIAPNPAPTGEPLQITHSIENLNALSVKLLDCVGNTLSEQQISTVPGNQIITFNKMNGRRGTFAALFTCRFEDGSTENFIKMIGFKK